MISNKTILIAGASSGIGRQVALLLSHHNNRIIVSARRPQALESLRKEIITNGSQVNFLVPLIAHMKLQGYGLIAHTNSLVGFLGLPMHGPYSAAKAAGRILMDSCRIELKPFGLKFVSIYPGFVATERVQGDGIPSPFEISEVDAAEHIVRALEKEKADYLFPFMTASLVRLARILPKSVVNNLLAKSVPTNY